MQVAGGPGRIDADRSAMFLTWLLALEKIVIISLQCMSVSLQCMSAQAVWQRHADRTKRRLAA